MEAEVSAAVDSAAEVFVEADLVGEEVDLEEVIEAAVHAEEPHLEERGPGGP